MTQIVSEKIEKLRQYFLDRPEIAMAFVFGSFAKALLKAGHYITIFF